VAIEAGEVDAKPQVLELAMRHPTADSVPAMPNAAESECDWDVGIDGGGATLQVCVLDAAGGPSLDHTRVLARLRYRNTVQDHEVHTDRFTR
jgi:hypothetical protein